MTNQPKPKGGKREGAGRKPLGSENMKMYSQLLPLDLHAYIKAQGGSQFVRELIEKHRDAQPNP